MFLVNVAISSLRDLHEEPKHFEHKILRYNSESIPEGPAEPFVRKAELNMLVSSISSKKHSGIRLIGPNNKLPSLIGASGGCFQFSLLFYYFYRFLIVTIVTCK